MVTPSGGATLRLRDGRTLGYLEVGNRDGPPILHFHGHGSSRLEARLIAEQATIAGVRLIALDRPGIGLSDPKPGAAILSWPDDVVEVANQLDLDRFAVAGVSGGGPYALACACRCPDRLTAVGLISSVAPPSFMRKAGPSRSRLTWTALEHLPAWLFRLFVRLSMRGLASSSDAAIEAYLVQNAAQLGAADARLLANPEVRHTFAVAVAEGYRQGIQAPLDEGLRLARDWGFRVDEIAFEKIFLWHGEQDRIVPVSAVRQLARALPQCTATFYPDDGHLSTPVNHAHDILSVLGAPTDA